MELEKERIARGADRYSLNNAGTFKEGDHPRGGDGKFGSGGGGKKTESNPTESKEKPKTTPKTRTKSKEDIKAMVGEFEKANMKTTPAGEMTISKSMVEKGLARYKIGASPKFKEAGDNYIVSKKELTKFLTSSPLDGEKKENSSRQVAVYRKR